MKTAYSYYRWSTKIQGVDGKSSFDRQYKSALEWMEQFGNKLGYVLSDDKFIDSGKSGYTESKRIGVDEYGNVKSEFQRFLTYVEQGTIKQGSILLVDEFSRFSRMKPTKSLPLFMDVINSGIGLVFCGSYDKRIIDGELIDKEPQILILIMGELIRSFRESEEKGRKVVLGIETKRQQIKNGVIRRDKLPFYFTFVPNVGSTNIGTYIHNDKVAIVQRIVTEYLNGKSLYKITQDLNKDKVFSVRGKGWNYVTVRDILTDRHLLGEHLEMNGYCPKLPAMDETKFNRLQNIKKQNERNFGKSGSINIFRGLTRCSSCEQPLVMITNGGYKYLRCLGKTTGKDCKNAVSCFPLPRLEIDFFTNFLFKSPKQVLNQSDSKEVNKIKQEITQLETELNNVTKTIQKLILINSKIEVAELETELTKLGSRRDGLKNSIDGLNLKLSSVKDVDSTFNGLIRLFQTTKSSVKYYEDGELVEDKIILFPSDDKKAIELYHKLKNVDETHIADSLKDSYTREGIRVMLPSLIGKIEVDFDGYGYTVFNRVGKPIYQNQVMNPKDVNKRDKNGKFTK